MSRLNKSLIGLVAISASSSSGSSSTMLSTATPVVQPMLVRNGSVNAQSSKSAVNDKTKRASDAKEIIRSADIVCFDVDSTVIKEEGIDELAEFCGKGQEVANLTREAMGGSMTFQEALRRRLDIIKPSQRQIHDFLRLRPSTLSPGIKDFIEHLKSENKKIFLISGGFHSLIDPVAKELDISVNNLFANKLLFDFNGNYAAFDTNQPTSRSGGKGEVIVQIRNFNRNQLMDNSNNELKIVMIGDGATDLESSPPADYFIGYGGNIIRDNVRDRAQFFVTDFKQLI